MSEIEAKLGILLDGLKKKEQALAEIVSITENQRTVIESGIPLAEVRAFIQEMNQSKQEFIQVVKDCDTMFENMLKEVGPQLDARQDMYTSEVHELQKWIRRVMDLDVKIRVSEEENNRLIIALSPAPPPSQGLKPKPSGLPMDSSRVIKAYEQGAKGFKG